MTYPVGDGDPSNQANATGRAGSETLRVRSWGPDHGPVLVLLHGFMGTSADWEPIGRALGAHIRVVAIDLPGHGESLARPDNEYTLEGAAASILQTLKAQSIDRFCLAGYSMGGRLALHIARAHPGTVQGLGLISAHTGLSVQSERDARLDRDSLLAASLTADFSRFLDEWFSLPMFSSLAPDLAATIKAVRLKAGVPPELARALTGLSVGRQDDFYDWFLDVGIPKLVLVGGRDDKYAALAAGLEGRGRRIMTRTLSEAGHNLLAEAPAEVQVELAALAFVCR